MMVTQAFANDDSVERAKEIVAYYTLAASVTGAVPVPAASVAVVAETGAMLSQLASHFGQEISVGTVVESVGFVGSLNVVGRSLFVEIGKALSWGTGQPWAAFALSAAGAATAGLQTYIIGLLAIEIGKNGGGAISTSACSRLMADAKATYEDFVRERKARKAWKPT